MSKPILPGRALRIAVPALAIFAVAILCWSLFYRTPFAVGDKFDGWKVTAIKKHEEFWRLSLVRHEYSTGVEITARPGGQFDTRYYRIQPAPGETPPVDLLRRLQIHLQRWESSRLHHPFIQTTKSTDSDKPHWGAPPVVVLTYIVAAVLSGWLLFTLFRRLSTRATKSAARLAVFWGITLTPLAILALVLVLFGWRILAINLVDTEVFLSELPEKLRGFGSYDFEITPTVGGFEYPIYYGPDQPAEIVAFDPPPGALTVFVFGGSSVIMPAGSPPFSAHLEGMLATSNNPPPVVYNFGATGLTLGNLLNRLKIVSTHHRPDLVIVYGGHNNYTEAYVNHINPAFFIFAESQPLRWPLRLLHDRILYPLAAWRGRPIYHSLEYYLRVNVEPPLNAFLQRLGVLRLDPLLFERANRMIADQSVRFLKQIAATCRELDTPVIFVTPISNLESRPHGPTSQAIELYEQGLRTSDTDERLRLLQQARDLDAFSHDVRAKSDFRRRLLQMHGSGVYVLDLETVMSRDGWWMGDNTFLDYVHFRPWLHRRVASELADFIAQQGLLTPTSEAGATPAPEAF